MLNVFTKVSDGKWLCVALCNEPRQAMQLLDAFKSDWLHEYDIRDSISSRYMTLPGPEQSYYRTAASD
jgi:hypothetical protein